MAGARLCQLPSALSCLPKRLCVPEKGAHSWSEPEDLGPGHCPPTALHVSLPFSGSLFAQLLNGVCYLCSTPISFPVKETIQKNPSKLQITTQCNAFLWKGFLRREGASPHRKTGSGLGSLWLEGRGEAGATCGHISVGLVPAYNHYPGVIISRVRFLSQKHPGLVDKFYGQPPY